MEIKEIIHYKSDSAPTMQLLYTPMSFHYMEYASKNYLKTPSMAFVLSGGWNTCI